ncbi:MAG: radical SAM family heme chaperone HemW [Clostridia bacterium]|nr:radical SAM family heme chaperone HemW [Clostridia bacterium]
MQIYIHIPFCKRKCLYCDFNSYANCAKELIFGYLTALNREIELAGNEFGRGGKNQKITSIFIGGGTPSLLDAQQIESLLENAKNHFEIDENAEITIEANPESLTEEKLVAYRHAGINRLSMGVQSLYDDNLQAIGRIHDVETAKNAINIAREHFDNLSCDLMIGLPFDTPNRVKEEVDELAETLDHISVYQLILEEGTPLESLVNEGKIALPNDDEVADLMSVAVKTLRENGFDRYEVSNFARHNKFSRHNMGYWTREQYLGIGAGAASFLKLADKSKEIRFSSSKSLEKYIKDVGGASDYFDVSREEFEELTKDDIFDEKIMLGLRTSKGVEKSLLNDDCLAKYSKYFVENGENVSLNDQGFAIMNTILVDLMRF